MFYRQTNKNGCPALVKALCFVLAAAVLFCGLAAVAWAGVPGAGGDQALVRARVQEVVSDEIVSTQYSGGQIETRVITLAVKILEGAFSGQVITVTQTFDEIGMASAYAAKVGDKLFVSLNLDENGNLTGYAADYVREWPLVALVGVFVLFILLFGRMQGVKTVLSLLITCGVLFLFFFPLAAKGYSPVPLSLFSVTLMSAVTMMMILGFSKKAAGAVLGCVGGLVIAGALATVFSYAMRLSGVIDEEAAYLRYISDDFVLDFKGILFAAILIGASGAAMDVAVSIASSLEELAKKVPDITSRQLFKSGVNIGRDIMGTMANTLILAYVGGAIHLVLLLYAYPVSFSNLFNREAVAAEILISLCGSIGMLATLPITAFVCAQFYRGKGGTPASGISSEE